MKLIEGKKHLNNEYNWIKQLTNPARLIAHITDSQHVVCAVAGTKPLIVNDTIWGKMPNRKGIISFYKTTDNIHELAANDPDIYYYWVKTQFKKPEQILLRSTTSEKPRATIDEPWHAWSEEKLMQNIVYVCEDMVYTNDPVDEICTRYGLTHWAFIEMFRYRFPEEYIEFQKYKKIPTKDQLTTTMARRFPHVSEFSQ